TVTIVVAIPRKGRWTRYARVVDQDCGQGNGRRGAWAEPRKRAIESAQSSVRDINDAGDLIRESRRFSGYLKDLPDRLRAAGNRVHDCRNRTVSERDVHRVIVQIGNLEAGGEILAPTRGGQKKKAWRAPPS